MYNKIYMRTASLVLFNSVVDEKSEDRVSLSEMIMNGCLVIDKDGNLVEDVDKEVWNQISTVYNLSSNWTNSLHKTWNKVAEAPIEVLLFEQVMHYWSTYGAEMFGQKSMNWVPAEEVIKVDGLKLKNFRIVTLISADELVEKTVNYMKNTKAPKNVSFINYLMSIVEGKITLDEIKSFEIKILFMREYNVVPSNTQDLLRFFVHEATGSTILIKNKYTLDCLKRWVAAGEAYDYLKNVTAEDLAKDFYRFKPFFLALKEDKRLKYFVNRLRRLAVKYHEPVSGMTASNLMTLVTDGRIDDAIKVIDKLDNRELVKLINFCKFSLSQPEVNIYNIRNGKMFIKKNECFNDKLSNIRLIKYACEQRLRSALDFGGKQFYIPNGIEYAAPASEKQMLDVYSYGTRVYISHETDAFVVAGHWNNVIKNGEEDRVDLDFHLSSVDGNFGWNAQGRDDDVLYSGDMTDAPIKDGGAVEAFRVAPTNSVYNLSVNCYTYNECDIPFELMFLEDTIDKEEFVKGKKKIVSAIVNQSNALTPSLNITLDNRGMVLGFIKDDYFCIYGGGIGGNFNVPDRDLMVKALDAMVDRTDYMITIDEIIKMGGGEIVNIPTTGAMDLSPNSLTPSTLLNLVDGRIE